jgi:hypothetical protein
MYTCIAVFGFAAALLETVPFIGLVFSISNQIGAAMWAHGMLMCCISENLTICANTDLDLEKRQHWFAEKKIKVL